jgi:hypothetical protein
MLRIRRLKLVYALASLLWLGYSFFELASLHISNRKPFSSGTLFCMLLFVTVPACGYVLLFKIFPWAGRSLRR